MFPVEIRLPDNDKLSGEMQAMRTWLDDQQFEPATFHYTFAPPGLVFRVDFLVEGEATAFARAFGGNTIAG